VPEDKATRVYNFHRNTLHALAELTGAAGLRHPGEIEPRHIVRRVSGDEIRLVANLYKFLKPGELLTNPKAHVSTNIIGRSPQVTVSIRSPVPTRMSSHASSRTKNYEGRGRVCRLAYNIPTAAAWLACAASDCAQRWPPA
jgi:hypothetical protein